MPRTPEAGDRPDIPGLGPLALEQCIHEYPGKRRIFRARLASGQPVVAKFYLGRISQWAEWRRGTRGARLLEAAGVAAPAVHHAAYCPRYRAWLLVLGLVEADEPWPPSGDDPGDQAHARLLATLADHHRAGIVQNDLNWLNFIPREGRLFAIDGDRVRRRNGPLGRRAALDHLQRLYASKTRLPETLIREGFRQYHEMRGWEVTEADLQRFLRDLRRARLQHARRVARRACRGWKHYPRFRVDELGVIHDRRALARGQAEHLARQLHETGELPDGLSGHADRSYRAQRIDAHWQALPGLLRPVLTRQIARRAWSHALTLRRLGLSVPRPVAIIAADRGLVWLVWETDPELRPLDAASEPPGAAAAETLWAGLRDYGIRFRGRDPRMLGSDGQALWILDPLPLAFGRPESRGFLRAAQGDRSWLERISKPR
ncbi:hypothetical protein [Thioalkalivibrio thiocyanoxidans]|uniref:hypothetical protein n=1 Tax=Thioalkalivibrio thiocyanoxidans TaxID=152475 RepID=UPI0003A95192|nr:hypothetical protein [Thioalkalivibrio thiocyanoxidans]